MATVDAARRRARELEESAASSSSSPSASSRAVAPAPAPALPAYDDGAAADGAAADGANYKGVFWDRARSKWCATLWNRAHSKWRATGKIETLGRFDTKIEAARAYDRRARTYAYARMNPRHRRFLSTPRARARHRPVNCARACSGALGRSASAGTLDRRRA